MLLDKRVPFRYIINKVKLDLVIVLIIGLFTHFLTTQFAQLIPEMPLSVPAFLGTAISVLLSFKMAQSYGRWWEARKIWGAIVNDSRTLIIQLQSFVDTDDHEEIKRMAFRQIAWCYALGNSLRKLNPLEGTEQFISEDEKDRVSSHTNKPLALIQCHASNLRKFRLEKKVDIFSHIKLDDTLTRLVASMGKAERIKGTVFPSTYRQFLHYAIYVFVVTLCISLQDVSVFFEIPLLLVIAAFFFLIEKSAYNLQDPFENRPSDVSVTAIARNIEINIRQMISVDEVPEAVKPQDFYLM